MRMCMCMCACMRELFNVFVLKGLMLVVAGFLAGILAWACGSKNIGTQSKLFFTLGT